MDCTYFIYYVSDVNVFIYSFIHSNFPYTFRDSAPSLALEDPATEDAHAGSKSAEREVDSDLLMMRVEQDTSDPTARRPDDAAEPPVSTEFR